jgi:hypothetical protein
LATARRETTLQSIEPRLESAFAVTLMGLACSSRSGLHRYSRSVSCHLGSGSLASPLPPGVSPLPGPPSRCSLDVRRPRSVAGSARQDLLRLASPSELSHRAGLANPPLLGSVKPHPHRRAPQASTPGSQLSPFPSGRRCHPSATFRLRSFALPGRLSPPEGRGFVAPRCRSDVRRVLPPSTTRGDCSLRVGPAPPRDAYTLRRTLLVDSRSASPRSVPSCCYLPS